MGCEGPIWWKVPHLPVSCKCGPRPSFRCLTKWDMAIGDRTHPSPPLEKFLSGHISHIPQYLGYHYGDIGGYRRTRSTSAFRGSDIHPMDVMNRLRITTVGRLGKHFLENSDHRAQIIAQFPICFDFLHKYSPKFHGYDDHKPAQ